MNPKAAIARLEAQRLGAGGFHHSDHIRMAWNYLREYPLSTAIGRYRAALKELAAHVGHPEKYHETITWAYMLIVNERMEAAPDQDWDTFIDANPELLRWPDGALQRYYTPGTMASTRARETFLMPDRLRP